MDQNTIQFLGALLTGLSILTMLIRGFSGMDERFDKAFKRNIGRLEAEVEALKSDLTEVIGKLGRGSDRMQQIERDLANVKQEIGELRGRSFATRASDKEK